MLSQSIFLFKFRKIISEIFTVSVDIMTIVVDIPNAPAIIIASATMILSTTFLIFFRIHQVRQSNYSLTYRLIHNLYTYHDGYY